jgi:hypothetical protein
MAGPDGVTLLGLRVFEADKAPEVRTVLHGLASKRLRRVQVSIRGGAPRTVRHDASGAFLLALRGYPADLQPVVMLDFAGGRTTRVALATSDNVIPDPLGGGACRTEVGGFGCPVRNGNPDPHCHPPTCVTFSSARQGARSAGSPGLCGRDNAGPGRVSTALFYGRAGSAATGGSRARRSLGAGTGTPHAPRCGGSRHRTESRRSRSPGRAGCGASRPPLATARSSSSWTPMPTGRNRCRRA